jgi:hypothetical protein
MTYRLPLFLLLALLAGCTPTHFYRGPESGPTAFLQERTTHYEDRNGESLHEGYLITSIDGKILRFNWKSAAVDGQYRLLPGSHKLIATAFIRRGSILDGSRRYVGVLEATLAENRNYFLNGATRFADNRLDMWIEDSDSGANISDVLSLDLSQPVPQTNLVAYPIYVPAER